MNTNMQSTWDRIKYLLFILTIIAVVAILLASCSPGVVTPVSTSTTSSQSALQSGSQNQYLIFPESRPDNGTSLGDFAPGFAGHLRPMEISPRAPDEELLSFNHHFQGHVIGTDEGSHAAVVRTTDFESHGRGGLDFKLERIYSSLEHYRRSNLVTLAAYLHPYYEHMAGELSNPNYFDDAYEHLFQTKLESAKDEQRQWWAVGNRNIDVCREPLEGYINEIYGHNRNEWVDIYGEWHLDIETCYIDQFGQTMMPTNLLSPSQKVEALLLRIEIVISYMRMWNYDYDEVCIDGDYNIVPESPFCDNPMVVLHLQLNHLFNRLKHFPNDFLALAEATDNYSIPEWWNSGLGDGWAFNLPFIELPGPVYDSDFDQPGAIHFDGYRRRVIGRDGRTIGTHGYVEFPDEQAIYWNLTAFRQYFNSGPGEYTPCDWIGDPWQDDFDYSCTPVPGTDWVGGLPLIAGQYRLELTHLVMQREKLYWFNDHGQLRFITDHTLKNNIEVAWKVDDLDNSRIDFIRDAAGNIYRFRYYDEVTLSSLSLLHHIEAESTGKKVSYFKNTLLGGTNLITVKVEDNNGGDSYETGYSYMKERILICDPDPVTTPYLDCADLNEYQYYLRQETNPLGGTVAFDYHPNDSDFIAVPAPFVASWDDVFGFYVYDISAVPTVRKLTRSYRFDHVETLYPKPIFEEIEDGGLRAKYVTIEWDRATEYTYISENNGRSQLQRTLIKTLTGPANPEERWAEMDAHLDNYAAYLGSTILGEVRAYDDYGNLDVVWNRHMVDGIGMAPNEGWTLQKYDYTGDGIRVTVFGLPDRIGFGSGPVHHETNFEYDDKYPWLVTHVWGDTIERIIQYDHSNPIHPHLKPRYITRTDGETEVEVEYRYDDYGNLETIVWPRGRKTEFVYHSVNGLENVFLEKIIDSASGSEDIVEEFVHDSTGLALYYKNPRGFETQNNYDAFGRLTRTQTASDFLEYRYGTTDDTRDQTVVLRSDPPSNNTGPEFEEIMEIRSDAFNNIRYWKNSRETSSASFTMKYDRRGRLFQTLREDRVIEERHYDELDRIITQIDARGGVWKTHYDDRLIDRTEELSCAWGRVSQQPLQKIRLTNPVGDILVRYVDARGRLAIEEQMVEHRFDGNGFTYRNHCWRYGWDDHDRLLFERSPTNTVIRYEWDGFDNLVTRNVYQVPALTDPDTYTSPPECAAGNLDCVKEIFTYNNDSTTTFLNDNRLRSYTDGNGHTYTYRYDGFGQLISVTDPLQRPTNYAYDPDGNIIREAIGSRVRTYTYDTRGYIRTFIDAEDNLSVYTHNFYGELVSLTEGLNGAEIDVTNLPEQLPAPSRHWLYGVDGLEEFENEEGNIYTWSYDSYGQLQRSTEPRGAVATKTYRTDGAGEITGIIDSEGARTIYTRDALGRITGLRTDTLGDRYHLDYNALGQIKSVTEFPGTQGEATWHYAYDPEGRPIEIISPEGRRQNFRYHILGWLKSRSVGPSNQPSEEWRYRYDKLGNLLSVSNPLGAVISFSYDEINRLKTQRLPYQSTENIEYLPDDKVVEYYDPNSNKDTFEFDGNGMFTKHVDQEGYTTTYEYDRHRRLVQQKYFNGFSPGNSYSESYSYYPTGLLRSIEYPTGDMQSFDYDPNGNLIVETDPMGLTTSYQYEKPHELPTLITLPSQVTTRLVYDDDGRITRQIMNPDGSESRSLSIEYVDDQRRVIVWQPGWNDPGSGSGILEYNFDRDGNVKSILKPGGGTIQFKEYDESNRLITLVNEIGTVFGYRYNELGQLESRTVNGLPNGETTQYRNDGKISTLTGIGGARTYQYNPTDGRLDGMEIDGRLYTSYTYYDNGWLESVRNEDGSSKHFSYNGIGLLSVLEEWDAWSRKSKQIEYEYDDLGNAVMERIGGREHTAEYYPNGLLKRLDDVSYIRDPKTGLLDQIAGPGGPDLHFTYNDFGQIVARTNELGFTETTGYYESGRIKSINGNTSEINITYDADGHPDVVRYSGFSGPIDYEYDEAGQLVLVKSTDIGSFGYEYDAAHNLTAIRDGDTAALLEERSFNFYNQLTEITTYAFDAVETTVGYDDRGNIIELAGSDGYKNYFKFDTFDRLRGISRDNDLPREFDYDAADRLVTYLDTESGSEHTLEFFGLYSLSVVNDGSETFFAPDPMTTRPIEGFRNDSIGIPTWLLGSAVYSSLEDGSVEEVFKREPYGKQLDGDSDRMPFGFKGYYHIPDIDQYWAYARSYDASLKSFSSPDPLRGEVFNPPSMNRYNVFSADAVSTTDWFGLCPKPSGPYETVVCAKKTTTLPDDPRHLPRSNSFHPTLTPEERLAQATKAVQTSRKEVNEALKNARENERRHKEYFEQAKRALANNQPLPPMLPPRIDEPSRPTMSEETGRPSSNPVISPPSKKSKLRHIFQLFVRHSPEARDAGEEFIFFWSMVWDYITDDGCRMMTPCGHVEEPQPKAPGKANLKLGPFTLAWGNDALRLRFSSNLAAKGGRSDIFYWTGGEILESDESAKLSVFYKLDYNLPYFGGGVGGETGLVKKTDGSESPYYRGSYYPKVRLLPSANLRLDLGIQVSVRISKIPSLPRTSGNWTIQHPSGVVGGSLMWIPKR